MGAIAVAAQLAQLEGAFIDVPEDSVVHRLYFKLRRRRCGRDLFVRPRLPPAPVRREGRLLGAAELYAGAQGGHQLGALRRRCGIRRIMAGLWR
jgi:hypothetical protein